MEFGMNNSARQPDSIDPSAVQCFLTIGQADESSSDVLSHINVQRLCCKFRERRAQRRTEPDTLSSRYIVIFILPPVVDISVDPIRRKKL
jgi:hypothetical protein